MSSTRQTQTLMSHKNVELIEIGHQMHQESLSEEFISSAVQTAFAFEGVYDLMKMWSERFDDLEQIAQNIRSFKDDLRIVVEENGGIKNLAKRTGIPQPSLSRFFSSNAMPRRVTLLKIARALNLSQIQIATEWAR